MQVRAVPTDQLGRVAASLAADAIHDAVERRGRAAVALSGGSTPEPMLTTLAAVDLPWTRVHVFQVDERVAPPVSDARNWTLLRRSLLDHVPAVAHPMPVDAPDLATAAAAYAAELTEHAAGSLDLVHLGLGSDGHTASLFPDDPVLDVHDRDVAVTGEHAGRRRMTLTFPVLDRAWLRLWLVAGEDKRPALADLVAETGPARTPAALVPRDHSIVVTDLEL